MHLDARLAFNIQLRQSRVLISRDVQHENSFVLGLVGEQLEAAEGNLGWAGIRDVWVKPQFEAT